MISGASPPLRLIPGEYSMITMSVRASVRVAPATAWAMAYGAGSLALFALLTGTPFRFDPRPAYAISLAYLSVFGSVIAFLVYFALARRRSYTFASYVSAITPPIAFSSRAPCPESATRLTPEGRQASGSPGGTTSVPTPRFTTCAEASRAISASRALTTVTS